MWLVEWYLWLANLHIFKNLCDIASYWFDKKITSHLSHLVKDTEKVITLSQVIQDLWEEQCDRSSLVSMQSDTGSLEFRQRKDMENTHFIGESQLSHL